MKTLLIAHRGNTNDFNENTIDAFESAFAKGADGIELDVQMHKGKLIAVHDYLFDQNQEYPELETIMKLFSDKGRIEIEVKSLDLDFLPSLTSVLSRYSDADIEITTSVIGIASPIRSAFPRHLTGIIFPNKDFEEWMTQDFICTKIIKTMKLLKSDVAHIQYQLIEKNSELVHRCHEAGIKVHSHIHKTNIDTETSLYKKFNELGIDQCTLDDVELISAVQR